MGWVGFLNGMIDYFLRRKGVGVGVAGETALCSQPPEETTVPVPTSGKYRTWGGGRGGGGIERHGRLFLEKEGG